MSISTSSGPGFRNCHLFDGERRSELSTNGCTHEVSFPDGEYRIVAEQAPPFV